MNVETVGLVFGIWFLAGFGFCALWALAHRPRDQFAAGKQRVAQLTLQQH